MFPIKLSITVTFLLGVILGPMTGWDHLMEFIKSVFGFDINFIIVISQISMFLH